MTEKRQRRKLTRRPRNLAEQDGLLWVKRAGRLWGDYKTCSEYMGIAPSSFATYVWRHNLKTIKHGRKSLASKDDLDRKSGALLPEDETVGKRPPFSLSKSCKSDNQRPSSPQ